MPPRPFAKLKIVRSPAPAIRVRFELPAWTFRTSRLMTRRSA